MNRTEILKIGAEGGSWSFYKIVEEGVVYFGMANQYRVQSAEELFWLYCKKHDPLLWYFPVEIDRDYIDVLMPILQDEVQQYGRDYFPNLDEWERKLNRKIEPKRHELEQTFVISPVVVEKSYSYNHYNNDRVLEMERIQYNIEPKHKKRIRGIGSIEGNAFVIRDEHSMLKGIFYLELYEIDVEA